MDIEIDHVVLWVEDPLRSVAFYVDVVGLAAVRLDEFREKTAPFPSLRLSSRTLLDLMPKAMAPMVNGVARKAGATIDAAGHPTNHVCLALPRDAYLALRKRLSDAGIDTSFSLRESFGARGAAAETFYFRDPDENVLEARYYDDPVR